MGTEKTILIYVRNKELTPSSYYRIVQYTKNFEGNVIIREIAPKKLYKNHLKLVKKRNFKWMLNSIVYYIVMLLRAIFYLSIDNVRIPKYLIVSKSFCPRYTPFLLRHLIKKISKATLLYWDFDDYIFESGEISKAQARILEEYSKKIIVTSEFLKSKINSKFQSKVILLPTTDGDMQGFDEKQLKMRRMSTFNKEVKLVWVATSGNIPNLEKIIPTLDKAAKIIKDDYKKNLVLTVVCNYPVTVKTQNLEIRNITWTRDRAIVEIYNAHIGIMPLIYKEYALGKGGFKLVQYISTGLPVIASDIGFNRDVVSKSCGILVNDIVNCDEWIDAIIQITWSWEKWESYSFAAYQRWKNNFSYERNLIVWKNLLQ